MHEFDEPEEEFMDYLGRLERTADELFWRILLGVICFATGAVFYHFALGAAA